MKTNSILAILASTSIGFFAGWLIYGMFLMGIFEPHLTEAAKAIMKKEPFIAGYLISNLTMAILYVYVFSSIGTINSLLKGLISGAVISVLITISIDFGMAAQMEMYDSLSMILVDAFGSAMIGGLMGATAAYFLGRQQVNP